jgi:hypothetical protein
MTPEADAQPQAEPTMEEILASIRKIIASDKPAEPTSAADDILELTDIVPEIAAIAPLPEPPPPPPPIIEEVVMPPPEPEPILMPPPVSTALEVPLVSNLAADASASVFAGLTQHLQHERQAIPTNLSLGDGQQTLEGLMIAMLRPMVKEWLDQNLPATVERLVAREIERIARAHRD